MTATANPPTTRKNRTSPQYGINVRPIDRTISIGFKASGVSNMIPLSNDIGRKYIP